MPLYSYRCDNCGVQFDRRQHYEEPSLRTCPECGKPALRKLIAPVGIVFKGSGFYSTDHRSTSGMNSSKAEKGESKPEQAESKSEKAETKSGKAATKQEASKAAASED